MPAEPAQVGIRPSHLVQGRGYAFLGSSQTRLPLGQFLVNGLSDKGCRRRKSARP